jgi:hypothetical protein
MYTLWGIKNTPKSIFTIISVKLSRFRLNLVDFFLKYIFHETVQTLLTYGSACYAMVARCIEAYSLRYTCIIVTFKFHHIL